MCDPQCMFEYWMQHKLYMFRDPTKTHWSGTNQTRYSRHKNLIQIIENHAKIAFADQFRAHDILSDLYYDFMLQISSVM